jgi:hypothetical protein
VEASNESYFFLLQLCFPLIESCSKIIECWNGFRVAYEFFIPQMTCSGGKKTLFSSWANTTKHVSVWTGDLNGHQLWLRAETRIQIFYFWIIGARFWSVHIDSVSTFLFSHRIVKWIWIFRTRYRRNKMEEYIWSNLLEKKFCQPKTASICRIRCISYRVKEERRVEISLFC